MKIVSVKMPETLIEKIDELAWELGISRSELIRLAITRYLLGFEKQTQAKPQPYKEEVVVIN
ncbi:MAG: CopG family transcriptional regulator [Staphylothermus sp.]|nr:CopG family transcriptional regulator [Staphylothermus sp.]